MQQSITILTMACVYVVYPQYWHTWCWHRLLSVKWIDQLSPGKFCSRFWEAWLLRICYFIWKIIVIGSAKWLRTTVNNSRAIQDNVWHVGDNSLLLSPSLSLQPPLFLCLPCASWSLQSGWSLQPCGRRFSRKMLKVMGCFRSLFHWWQTLFPSCSQISKGPNLSWDSELG